MHATGIRANVVATGNGARDRLVVHGEDEAVPMVFVTEWTTALPHARLLRAPRAAHFSDAERPELEWPAVKAFLCKYYSGSFLLA